jgi:hypothetical protein
MEPPICLTVQAWAAKSVQFTSATDTDSTLDWESLRQPFLFNCYYLRSEDCPLARLHGFARCRARDVGVITLGAMADL